MPPPRLTHIKGTLTPFLYPFLLEEQCLPASRKIPRQRTRPAFQQCRKSSTLAPSAAGDGAAATVEDRLNPSPESYSLTPFADRCIVTLNAGSGGHGCVSFLREKYIEEGPPNGGDGGTGGNIFLQAVRGETSLHKIARRRVISAQRGRNGQGKARGGERGEDILITVPVGTVVREIARQDPVAQEEKNLWIEEQGDLSDGQGTAGWNRRDKWLIYPGTSPAKIAMMTFPPLPPPRRSHLAALEPSGPLRLDLDKPMDRPMLLLAGAMGGLGNSHFETRESPRPKFATRGEQGTKVSVQLELKLLADVALVGLPNAGKSTLLRAISNSNARVGDWAFTTLQPNIGTVVLDNNRGRPKLTLKEPTGELRTNFTIADIPGIIEDAHLDKGLGLGFLRHVERAAVLAFVVDLSAGDAVLALQGLWKEVYEYELQREREINAETQRTINYNPRDGPFGGVSDASDLFDDPAPLPSLALPPLTAKPWFVVATKADLADTQDNFANLQAYLKEVEAGRLPHPCGKPNSWRRQLHGIPISARRAEGVDRIAEVVVDLLHRR